MSTPDQPAPTDTSQPGSYTSEGGHGAVPTNGVPVPGEKGDTTPHLNPRDTWPLWEVFVRPRRGMSHSHVGSLHAPDAKVALRNARDLYTRRSEGVSVWVVPAATITASSPDEKEPFFDPAGDKVYRHPTFYEVPEEAPHL